MFGNFAKIGRAAGASGYKIGYFSMSTITSYYNNNNNNNSLYSYSRTPVCEFTL
jgi:hypothetical protein